MCVCVCQGYYKGEEGCVGRREGRRNEYMDFSCFERYGAAAGREREKGREQGSKGRKTERIEAGRNVKMKKKQTCMIGFYLALES